MIYLPVSLLLFLLFVFLFPFVWLAIALDVVTLAVGKLGLTPTVAFLLFGAVLVGSTVNIPLYAVETTIAVMDEWVERWMRHFWGIPLHTVRQKTIVAINVGGGVIPVLLALYQFTQADALDILAATAIVTVVSYFASEVVPGIGIQMNALVAPIAAALCAMLFAGTNAPAVAFAGGVLGTVIGADLLHLKELERMTAGVLSIGGAGVFDGIALCGLFSLLLT